MFSEEEGVPSFHLDAHGLLVSTLLQIVGAYNAAFYCPPLCLLSSRAGFGQQFRLFCSLVEPISNLTQPSSSRISDHLIIDGNRNHITVVGVNFDNFIHIKLNGRIPYSTALTINILQSKTVNIPCGPSWPTLLITVFSFILRRPSDAAAGDIWLSGFHPQKRNSDRCISSRLNVGQAATDYKKFGSPNPDTESGLSVWHSALSRYQ